MASSITIVKHKQSSTSAHEVADRPSLPTQVEGLDTMCDTIGAHIEPPMASPMVVVLDTSIEPSNTTINRLESTLGCDIST